MHYRIDVEDLYKEDLDRSTMEVVPNTKRFGCYDDHERWDLEGYTIHDTLQRVADILDMDVEKVKERIRPVPGSEDKFTMYTQYHNSKLAIRTTYMLSMKTCTNVTVEDMKSNWGKDEHVFRKEDPCSTK